MGVSADPTRKALLLESLKIQNSLATFATSIATSISAELTVAIERLENRKDAEANDFAVFDKKSNQLMQALSAVLKALAEMQGIGAGDRAGL